MNAPRLDGPLAESRQSAVARLSYAVQRPGGLAVLCGPSGSGVSTVLSQLAATVDPAARRPAVRKLREWDADAMDAPLPGILLADDADDGDGAAIHRLLDRCRQRQAATSLVLAGHGRLLSLIGRDAKLETAVLLRAVLRPFSLAETRSALDTWLTRPGDGRPDDAVVRTIHELSAGIPASVKRLAELAGVVAAGRADGRLSALDIEAVHRRLCLRAA